MLISLVGWQCTIRGYLKCGCQESEESGLWLRARALACRNIHVACSADPSSLSFAMLARPTCGIAAHAIPNGSDEVFVSLRVFA